MNARSSDGTAAVAPARSRIVVGLDAATAAGPTTTWATGEATARQTSLRTVRFDATGSTDDGDPRATLLADAAVSDLVIVGAATSGVATRWLRTCTPRVGSRRISCPIIVVRGDARQPLRRIVVGIGTPSAADATVEWAADEASRHDAELVVVHAWQPAQGSARSLRSDDLARSDAQCIVDLAVRHSEKRSDGPVRGELVEGDAVSALTTASGHADLIVIGSRGNGFRTLTFGPVALLLVEQAACPVALIPPQLRAAQPDTARSPG